MQVNHVFILYNFFIVFALVANKSDLYEQKEVDDEEGKKFAKENGLIFKVTSANSGIGVFEIFNHIGEKLIDINQEDENNNKEEITKSKTMKLNKTDVEGNTKRWENCCFNLSFLKTS